MTRIQKRKLITAVFLAGTFVLLTANGVFYYYCTTHLSPIGHKMYVFGALTCTVLYVIFVAIINRKKKVVLMPEERRQTLRPQMNLSNRFEWRLFLLTNGMFLYGILTINFYQIARWGTFELIYWSTFGLVVIMVFVLLFAAMKRNEYIIEGNTLIVREYKFKRLDTDLRIPINTIGHVYIKNHYTILPKVILEIGTNKRELRCVSHPEQLAVAILQRSQANI